MSLSQMIFSDPAIRDIMNSKKEVEIKRLEKYSATLDITAETSGAYLNYLKAKSFLGVEEENLEDLRANHTIAEQRNSKGIGTEDELLRWQSEISKAESDVIESGTVVAMARVILNQLMNRPQNSSLAEEDVGLEMARYYVGTKYMNPFIGNFNTLEKFAEFMVDEGIMNSPEMKTLEITIKQQKQAKNTAARKFFLPEAYLTGDLKKKLEKKYIDGGTHEDDHADWTVGLKLSYPLFEGGNKVFDLDRQKAELERLFFKRELAAQNIELEVRKACYLMYHSYQNISLSHSSMLDASENLAMITDKYAEGKASVTDMIVAQQDKITKERDAVTAVYDFLLNLVNFDRAVSNFYFLALPEERKKWLNGLYKYLSEI
jgi:outer membrane protein TolC